MIADNRWFNRDLAQWALLLGMAAFAPLAGAQTVFFSTGNPDGKIATLARPSATGKIETETADDFILATPMRITQATFVGLLPTGAALSSVTDVNIELYHVFPADSVNPPSGNVPTRVNSPSDVECAGFDSATGTLSYTAIVLNPTFSVINTVINGINKIPNQLTGGEGAATGQEVQFTVTFNPPVILPADHYFFRPEVQLSSGNFLWLSAPKPIVAPGTPFTGDLQSWIRNDNLDPDWLRIGTDITGQGPFNAVFSLIGDSDVGTPFFNTGTPDAKIATLARPGSTGLLETETADDFILTTPMRITQATFTGLLPTGAPLSNITDVNIELYHVFPVDSVNPPSGNVPTRANSPSDVDFADYDSASPHTLIFTATTPSSSPLTVSNTVINGINKIPNQFTGGEGSTTGEEVQITVTFNPPIVLQADHIFLRPEVQLSSGNFLLLSAPKPIVAPGTPFTGDLQSWIRNSNLEPDWLRIGTDITGQGPFNAVFSLTGDTELPTCTFSLGAGNVNSPAAGGAGSVSVTNPQNCEWTATSNASFVTITGAASGVGSGTLTFFVQQNTGAFRSGTLTIGGQTFTVNQTAGGSAPPPVIIFSPGQGATGVSVTASVTWGAVSGATSYDVYFGTSNPPPFVTNTTGTSYSPGSMLPNTLYYWFVTSKNAFGSTQSALWFFTTGSASACSFNLSTQGVNLPATGTSTAETCPNNSGQPSCGVNPEVPVSFTVTPTAACGAWTATSSNPGILQITNGTTGNGNGTVSFVMLNNTHNGPQSNTITVAGGGSQSIFTVTEAGSGDSVVFREVYALYEQLLGRDPDAAGFAFWSGSGGAGLGQMADSFLTSPEAYNSDFAVMAAYQAATGAPPLFAQYNAAVTAIRAGRQSITGLFSSLIPNPNSFSATDLYNHLLGRAPTGNDTGCINQGLAACFETIVGLPSNTTPVGANSNNEFQNTGTFRSGADHSNSLYVRMVYFVTVSRDPDQAGFNFWLGIANQGGPGLLFEGSAGFPVRIQILGPGTPNQGFIGSPEFQGLFAN